ncbi:hypothetical protein C7S15_8118 [Burkholderia cepacia]|nr:hypothetical protein [Burkholderia cepacia]
MPTDLAFGAGSQHLIRQGPHGMSSRSIRKRRQTRYGPGTRREPSRADCNVELS